MEHLILLKFSMMKVSLGFKKHCDCKCRAQPLCPVVGDSLSGNPLNFRMQLFLEFSHTAITMKVVKL